MSDPTEKLLLSIMLTLLLITGVLSQVLINYKECCYVKLGIPYESRVYEENGKYYYVNRGYDRRSVPQREVSLKVAEGYEEMESNPWKKVFVVFIFVSLASGICYVGYSRFHVSCKKKKDSGILKY